MENNDLSGMVEAALMAVMANLILFIGNFMPLVGVLIMMVTPLPFIVLLLRRPLKYTVFSVALGSILAIILIPFPISLMLPLYGGVIGLVMGMCIEKKVRASMTILYTGIAASIAVFAILTIFQVVMGQTIADVLIAEYQTVKTGVMDVAGNQAFAESFMGTETEIVAILTTLLPAMLITMMFLAVIGNYFVSREVLKRLRLPIVEVEPFARFRFPNSMIYGVTFMLILSYLSGYLGLVNQNLLLANIVIIVLYLLMAQGLACVYYGLEKVDLPKQVRIMIIVGLMIFQVGPFLSLLGWIDSIIDFRAIHRKKLPKK